MSAHELAIRITANADQARSSIQDTTKDTTKLDDAVSKVGDNRGLDEAAKHADKLAGSVGGASDKAAALTSRLEMVRNAGAGLAVAGAAGLVLSNNLANAFTEADRLSGRLSSMMTGKGLSDGIEQVKQLGNEIAGLTGGDDDAIATAIGGAIASGRLNGLREYGIVISAAGQESIAAAGKISAQAKAQETLNQVMLAGGAAVENLRANTSEATQALGEFEVRMGNAEEAVGEGAARAKAALLGGILSPILDIIETSPEAATALGGITYATSGLAAVIGGGVGLVAQVGMAIVAFKSLGVTGSAALTMLHARALPLLAVMGKIVLVAALAAAAIYAVDRIRHASEDAQAEKGQKAVDAQSQGRYEWYQKVRDKRGEKRQTFAEFEAGVEPGKLNNPYAAPEPGAGTGDINNIKAQYDSLMSDTSVPSMPAAGGGDDIASLQAEIDKADLAKDKDGKKALQIQMRNLRASQRIADKNQRTAEREAKLQKREEEKVAKYADNVAERQRNTQADIAIAQLNADTEIAVARLNAQRSKKGDNSAIDLQVAALERDAAIKEADLRAGVSDSAAESGIQKIARIKAAADYEKAQIEASTQKGGMGSTLAFLRGGGSFRDLAAMEKAGNGSTMSTGGSMSSVSVPLSFTKTPTATNQLLIKVFGELLIDNPVEAAFGGLNR